MKRCKHTAGIPTISNTLQWEAGSYFAREDIGVSCRVCGKWQPLGPAADSPAALCELRAAEIAALVVEADARFGSVELPPDCYASSVTVLMAFLSSLGCDGAEVAGWLEAQYDSDKLPEQPGEHAGYLARLIYEHKEEA